MQYFRFMRAATFAAFAMITVEANAACFECDDVVDLNQSYASCYLNQFDQVVEKIAASTTGFSRVNLGACNGDTTDGNRSITSMPLPGTTEREKLKSVYTLDIANAQCLKKQLDGYAGDFEPAVTFELYKLCSE